jgi:hypothetical protein
MHHKSHRAIVDTVQALVSNFDIKGTVRVNTNAAETRIDISLDNRKYIGRVRLELSGDKFLVYLMDKTNGKIATSDQHSAKSAYLEIKNKKEADLFVKWYVIITQLSALRRTRA